MSEDAVRQAVESLFKNEVQAAGDELLACDRHLKRVTQSRKPPQPVETWEEREHRKNWGDLSGKIVESVWLESDQCLRLEFSDGSAAEWFCTGECCSHSYISHLNGLQFLVGSPIQRVVPRIMGNERGSETTYYGWTIFTLQGCFDIEMRNESNGYYGGEFCRVSKVGPRSPEAVKLLADF